MNLRVVCINKYGLKSMIVWEGGGIIIIIIIVLKMILNFDDIVNDILSIQ